MVFNPLEPSSLVAALGPPLRAAAKAEGAPDAYARGQLLSGTSIVRLLAAELEGRDELLEWLRAELDTAMAGGVSEAVAVARRQIEAAPGTAALGEALAVLLATLRESGEDAATQARVRAVLRRLTERELEVLAAPRSRA